MSPLDLVLEFHIFPLVIIAPTTNANQLDWKIIAFVYWTSRRRWDCRGGGNSIQFMTRGVPLGLKITHPVLEWNFQIPYSTLFWPVHNLLNLCNLVSKQIQIGSPKLPLQPPSIVKIDDRMEYVATDDYAKDGGPGAVWTSRSFNHNPLRHWLFIWWATKLKFTSYL